MSAKNLPPFFDPIRPVLRNLGDAAGELQAATQTGFVSDLSHLGILQFTGEDARSFLQAQLSCDVDAIAGKPASTLGAYCSPKGRVLASLLLWQQNNAWYMVMDRSLLGTMQKRLSLYVLRAKVKIDMPPEMVLLGAGGPAGAEGVRAVLKAAPPEKDTVHVHERMTAIGFPGSRSLLMTTATEAEELWHALSSHAPASGTSTWEWSDIHHGIPWISMSTQDQFVPQMINLEALGGVSFKKGCYPGQEIVARTQHLGKVKRRMYLANVPDAVAAGAPLYGADAGGQSNGMVVNAVAVEGGSDMLVVIQCDSVGASSVHLAGPSGPSLRFMPLPYQVGSGH